MARVTLVVNDADQGSETFLRSLADGLGRAGHTVTVHPLNSGRRGAPRGSADPTAGPLRSRALPAVRSPRFGPAAARLALDEPTTTSLTLRRARKRFGLGGRAGRAAALAAPLLATRPDIVHIGFSGIGVALGDALELLDGVRTVVSCRGTGELVRPVLDESARAGLARLLPRIDAVHAVAGAVRDAVVALGAHPDRVVVIPPAVDVDRVRRKTAHQPEHAELHLVTVARLHWIKALDLALTAVARLRADGREVTLDVIGGGPESDALRFRAHVLRIDDAVRFLGPQPHDEALLSVEAADAFVLCSLSEGIANAALEAMALEVPVVSTAVGGMAEVITDGVDGLLVQPGDPVALAAALTRLASEPGLGERLGAAGRRRVEAAYSSDLQRRSFATLYDELSTRVDRPV